MPFRTVVGSFTDSQPGAVRDERAFVGAAYRDLLGRRVDPAAATTWTALLRRSIPRRSLTALLVGSEEGRREDVRRAHRALLGRRARPDEVRFWSAGLAAGTSFRRLRADLLGSAEAYAAAGATPRGFVRALGAAVLGRRPDADLAAVLRSRLRRVGRTGVAFSLLGGTEARQRIVRQLYERLLGRPPSPDERRGGVAALAFGLDERALAGNLVSSGAYLRALPNDYDATVRWAGQRTAGTVRSAGSGRFDVEAGRRLDGGGDVPVRIEVRRSDGSSIVVGSRVQVVGPRNERALGGIYRSTLRRAADAGAITTWLPRLAVGGGASRTFVAVLLASSDEARRGIVGGIFDDYLGRRPSSDEARFWSAQLASRSPDALRAAILGSAEYRAAAGSSQPGFLRALFGDVVRRRPTEAERAGLGALLDGGASREAVARSLLSGLEADRYVVRDLFDRTLRRRPGRAEVRFWSRAMVGGLPEVGVLGALAGSLEFFDRFPRSEG